MVQKVDVLHRVYSESISVLLSNLVRVLSGFVASVFISRILGPHDYGIYTFIISIHTLIVAVGVLGIDSSNLFFLSKMKYRASELLCNSLYSTLIIGTIAIFLSSLIIFILKDSYFKELNAIQIFFMVLTIPFSLLFFYLYSIIQGIDKVYIISRTISFRAVMLLGLSLSSFAVFGRSLSYMLLAWVTSVLLITFLMLAFLRNEFNNLKFNKVIFVDSFRFGIKVHTSNILTFLNKNVPVLFAAFFLPIENVGFFTIALLISETILNIPISVNTSMFQKVASLRNGEGNATVAGAMRHVMFLAVVTGLVVALVTWLLIGVIWGESYMPARELVYILIAGNILNSGLIILSTHFIGQRGEPLWYSMMLLAGLIANIAGAVLLIPRVGILGAAATYAVSQAIVFSTAVYYFRKGADMRLSDMLFIKREERRIYLEYIKRLGGLR